MEFPTVSMIHGLEEAGKIKSYAQGQSGVGKNDNERARKNPEVHYVRNQQK